MAFDFTKEDTATIGTTQYSMPADTTTGVPTSQTDACQLQAWINILSMAIGDEFVVKLYEKFISGGAQIVVEEWRLVYPTRKLVLPAMILHVGWDLTITKVTGTDRAVEWSLRKVT